VPTRGDFVKTFPLSGDPTASPATYKQQYTESRTKQVNVGLNVHGVQLGLTATSDFTSGIEITYTLIAGTDYELFYANDCDGLLFATPAESPEMSAVL